jgi:hypothetical protein
MLKTVTNIINASQITGVLPVVNGGTGVTTSTGTGNTVLSAAPTLSGNVTLSTGNLVVGTAGKGIDFSVTGEGSGTMTSELLADYEEGTWTPTDNSGATLSFTTAAGYYTKVGRLVVATFRIIFPVTANASASFFGGLPFVSKNGGNQEQQGGGMRYTNSSLTFNFVNGQGTSTFQPALNNGNAIANSLFSTFIIDGMIVYQTA